MSVGEIITYAMLAFALLGGLDRAFGSRLGLGKAFERGFESMGALVLAMVGLMAAAPLIAQYLAPVLTPFFNAIGIDPSVVAGSLLINDSGGLCFGIPLGTLLLNILPMILFSGLFILGLNSIRKRSCCKISQFCSSSAIIAYFTWRL